MPNAARVTFKTTNQTQRTTTPLEGLSFVLGQTLRGPHDDPKEIMNSWEQFKRTFGGIPNHADRGFAIQAKKILEAGGKLRVCRVINHATPPAKPGIASSIIGEFDADLVSGETIDVSVDSTSIGTVDFTTDMETTMGLIADLLLTHQHISSAILSPGDSTFRTLIITQSRPLADITIAMTGQTASWTQTEHGGMINYANELVFSFSLKYLGRDYSNIIIELIPSTNGDPEYFGIKIYHLTDTSLSETYNNLKVEATADPHFLDIINQQSSIVEVGYIDTSGITELKMITGLKYGFLDVASDITAGIPDYIGDSASQTGFFSFDSYEDALQIAVLNKDETLTGLHEAGADYAYGRKDIVYFAHLSNSSVNKDQYIAARGNTIDNKFCAFYGGGVKITDPLTSLPEPISELADIIIAANRSDTEYSPYYSFAGPNRGLIFGTLGIVNNYGPNAKYPDLNELANHQINMAINRDGKTMLWGNFTAQLDDNQEKYLHIVRGMITMIKTLRPTLETFLEEPCMPPTWNRMYYTVKPFLDSLVGEFFHSYEWVGDQFATGVTDADLQVNTAADVADGKYKAKLIVTLIASMQEIEIEIISTVAGVQVQF